MNEVIEKLTTWISDIETIVLNGAPYAAADAQRDVRMLVNASNSLNDEKLLWWASLAVSVLSSNYHDPQSVEQDSKSILNLVAGSQQLNSRYPSYLQVVAAIDRLGLRALESYKNHPKYEEIMMNVKKIAQDEMGQGT